MHIAIAGGGLGGLTLARILHRRGVTSTVYEREAHRSARSQGGMLDLHPESGQKALAAAGLDHEFRAEARPEGGEHRILDPAGRTLVHHVPPPGSFDGRPEIDRTVLREMLLDLLPDGTVAWQRRLVSAVPAPGGGFELAFESGHRETCDLLVGADGARSVVRPLLTDAAAAPVSVVIELRIGDVDRRYPDLAELAGPGNLWCMGASRILSTQRLGDGSLRVGVSLPADDRPLDTWRSKAALLALFDGWNPRLTALIDAADEPPVPRLIEATPPGVRWPHRPGVTLIGDAAHLMPPVGEGANQALLDAADLADRITAVQEYEEAMFTRIQPIAEMSARIQAMMLSPGAADAMVRFFTPRKPEQPARR